MFVCPHCSYSVLLEPRQFPFVCKCGQRFEDPQGTQRSFPPPTRMAWNLASSLAAFVADGMRTVDADQYEARLEVCQRCDRRRQNRCLECGCNLSLKARGRAFKCPLNKWPDLPS